jgi:hypothetical protein
VGKRFRDTEIWGKPWYRKLKPAQKVAWDYILDRCDAVGVWVPDFEAAEFFVGERVDWKELEEAANGNIAVLPDGKWFVVDFCGFQYGELDEKCKPHASYLSLLRRHGLEGYPKGIHTLQEKEKEKEQEKEPEEEKEEAPAKDDKSEFAARVTLKASEHEKLVSQYGEVNTRRAIAKLSAYKLEKGKVYKSDYGAILNWVMREILGGKGAAVPEPVRKSGPPEVTIDQLKAEREQAAPEDLQRAEEAAKAVPWRAGR